MDLLLILFAATFLLALGLAADRVGRDLSGGYRLHDRNGRADTEVRPMRLELLAISPDEYARLGRGRAGQASRRVARDAPAARPFDSTGREATASYGRPTP